MIIPYYVRFAHKNNSCRMYLILLNLWKFAVLKISQLQLICIWIISIIWIVVYVFKFFQDIHIYICHRFSLPSQLPDPNISLRLIPIRLYLWICGSICISSSNTLIRDTFADKETLIFTSLRLFRTYLSNQMHSLAILVLFGSLC